MTLVHYIAYEVMVTSIWYVKEQQRIQILILVHYIGCRIRATTLYLMSEVILVFDSLHLNVVLLICSKE